MRYPLFLQKNDTIGTTAPSMGVSDNLIEVLDGAIINLNQLGFKIKETASVRKIFKAVSASPRQRAKEFMSLYFDDEVKAIIPARGGEFLMDMLPYLDYEKIKSGKPKWILGFSDISTLLFTLTLKCDLAGAHGPLLIHFDGNPIDETTSNALNILQSENIIRQESIGCLGENFSEFIEYNPDVEKFSKDGQWILLGDEDECNFKGRLIGGGLDTLRSLIGTPFAPVREFISKYYEDGFIWYLESCSMNAGEIYKTLWQMKMNGWFENCKGVLYGRPDGYSDFDDFTLPDALKNTFSEFNVPIIYNVDLGHIPPQLTLINGAVAEVEYKNSIGIIIQKFI